MESGKGSEGPSKITIRFADEDEKGSAGAKPTKSEIRFGLNVGLAHVANQIRGGRCPERPGLQAGDQDDSQTRESRASAGDSSQTDGPDEALQADPRRVLLGDQGGPHFGQHE